MLFDVPTKCYYVGTFPVIQTDLLMFSAPEVHEVFLCRPCASR